MFKKNLLLLLTAFIWGFDFVAQHVAMDSIGPAFFCFIRFSIASFVMLAVVLVRNKKDDDKSYIKYGVISGLVLFFATYFQQYGLVTIAPGKSGFISALYIVFVPILSLFVKKEKPTIKLWLCVGVALFGLYLLTYKGSLLFEIGDLSTLVSAFLYSIQILLIDKYCPGIDPYKYNFVQFAVTAVLSFVCVFVTNETMSAVALKDCVFPILYVSVIGTCVSYMFQTLGQINNNPTIASLIMSLESVFAVLSGYLILNSKLQGKEIIGCVLIFIAIISVQLPNKKKN